MLQAGAWKLAQQNLILFVLIDAGGNEVAGLGSTFTLQLSKAGGAFQASAGAKAEVGDGWYSYLSTQGEANTVGPVAIQVVGTGTIQQNLEYIVETRTINSVQYTYTVTDSTTHLPIAGVCVTFTTDNGGSHVVWSGYTDALGIARDSAGQLPRLDVGSYYVWRSLAGRTFVNPDQESVS